MLTLSRMPLLMHQSLNYLSDLFWEACQNFGDDDVSDDVVRLLVQSHYRQHLVVDVGDEEEKGHFNDPGLDLFPFGRKLNSHSLCALTGDPAHKPLFYRNSLYKLNVNLT